MSGEDLQKQTSINIQEKANLIWAIVKTDMLIKGGNADNMRLGDTLGDDQFEGYRFDYFIANPPSGIDWKASEKRVKAENSKFCNI